MKKIRVLSIFGTRPEATKMVPLVLALDAHASIESVVCVTAQHRDLLDQVLEPFDIKPAYDLNLMVENQSLSELTSRALTGLQSVLRDLSPDLVLAHGDTTTTFVASLAAYYARIRLGHVEAGLRTGDKYQPYPEEMNRKMTTALADIHFAPTTVARDNLLKENVPTSSIFVTGNTAIDFIPYTLKPDYTFHEPLLRGLDFARPVIVMTAHRRENLGEPLQNIFRAVIRLIQNFPDITVVYAVHPNPAVKKPAYEMLSGLPRVILTEPLDVYDMLNLMRRSYMVLTDSGGLQEEAPALNKPVVVLRNVTERPEGLATGAIVLAGDNEDKIFNTAAALLTDPDRYNAMSEAANPFGDGQASERIVQAILYTFGLAEKPLAPFAVY